MCNGLEYGQSMANPMNLYSYREIFTQFWQTQFWVLSRNSGMNVIWIRGKWYSLLSAHFLYCLEWHCGVLSLDLKDAVIVGLLRLGSVILKPIMFHSRWRGLRSGHYYRHLYCCVGKNSLASAVGKLRSSKVHWKYPQGCSQKSRQSQRRDPHKRPSTQSWDVRPCCWAISEPVRC